MENIIGKKFSGKINIIKKFKMTMVFMKKLLWVNSTCQLILSSTNKLFEKNIIYTIYLIYWNKENLLNQRWSKYAQ